MKNIRTKIGIFLMAAGLAGFFFCTLQEKRDREQYQRLARTGNREENRRMEEADGDQGKENTGRESGTKPESAGVSVIPAYDWEGLADINGDITGWIWLPGSSVNYPVVQASDNDFYLHHGFSKEKNLFGCPFMDRDTAWDDFVRVIYGHSISSDSDAMFSPLMQFRDENFLDENPVFCYTEVFEEPESFQVMAVMDYHVNDVYAWDFRERNFPDDKTYRTWMEQLKERALFFREPEEEPRKLLILSTCCRQVYGKNGRFLIFLYA